MAPPIMAEMTYVGEIISKPQPHKHIDDEFKTNLRKLPFRNDFNTQTTAVKNSKVVEANSLDKPEAQQSYKVQLVWRNIIIFIYLHVAALYGLYLAVTNCKFITFVFTVAEINSLKFHLWDDHKDMVRENLRESEPDKGTFYTAIISAIGLTAGAHRLWSHRSYKAKWQLRVILMILQTMVFQNSIYEWVRDHRVHHKFTDTNADPHNSKRGFFFSHIGWLICKKHPDVKEKGKMIDMSDLEADPIVMFQHRHYLKLVLILWFLFPILTPYYVFGENLSTAYHFSCLFRYVFILNGAWTINSAAHMWGNKPYDKTISPIQSYAIAYFTNGEGFHNYHHTFPWDYKSSEFASYFGNTTTGIIDMLSRIGWAYDLKTVPHNMLKARVLRTGDRTHRLIRQWEDVPTIDTNTVVDDDSHENMIWGWGDPDMEEDHIKNANIIYKQK